MVDYKDYYFSKKNNFLMNRNGGEKKINIYTITVSGVYFELIRTGKKKIEGRLFSKKFREMKPGDILNLINQSKDSRIKTEIIKINKYKNFIEMLKAEGLRNVAPNLSSIEEADKVYHTYFKEYQIKKYGVCAIHLKIIS